MRQSEFAWVTQTTHNFEGKLLPFLPFFGSK